MVSYIDRSTRAKITNFKEAKLIRIAVEFEKKNTRISEIFTNFVHPTIFSLNLLKYQIHNGKLSFTLTLELRSSLTAVGELKYMYRKIKIGLEKQITYQKWKQNIPRFRGRTWWIWITTTDYFCITTLPTKATWSTRRNEVASLMMKIRQSILSLTYGYGLVNCKMKPKNDYINIHVLKLDKL